MVCCNLQVCLILLAFTFVIRDVASNSQKKPSSDDREEDEVEGKITFDEENDERKTCDSVSENGHKIEELSQRLDNAIRQSNADILELNKKLNKYKMLYEKVLEKFSPISHHLLDDASLTYQSAKEFCINKGGDLCYHSQICPQNAPVLTGVTCFAASKIFR